jgi:HlyD family secretion protein
MRKRLEKKMGSSKTKKGLRVLSALAGGVGLLLLMLYMAGVFTTGKIRPGTIEMPKGEVQPRRTASASVETVTEFYESVGTVRPKTETRVDSQIMGRVVEVNVRSGDSVTKGQELIRLDSREFEVRLEQALQVLSSAGSRREQMEQAVIAAGAELDRAEAAFTRTRTYFDSKAATAQDMEQAEATYRQAKARLEQAEKATREAESGVKQAMKGVEETRIALGYTRVSAPEAGEVARRLVEPGDLAIPGRPLLVLQTRGNLRLEALIPESLIIKIRTGTVLELKIDALDRFLTGTVEEVVPSADPTTRTILVKVSLPEQGDVFPGMFGSLLLPVKEREAVLIPKRALRRIGQLEVVTVALNGRWEQVFVTTGRVFGEKIEVLSGLAGNEMVAVGADDDA